MKKIRLAMLLVAPLMVGALAGCGPKVPDEYDLMKFWAGNPSEEVYAVNDSTEVTKISYTDAIGEAKGGWQYVSRSFSYDSKSISTFSNYNKITFTGKLETTSGSNVVMVKVEGEGGTFEKKFNFSSTETTYEFGLSFVSDWTKVNSMLFFVNRETSESGSGMITLTKCALSKEAPIDKYNIAASMPAVPQDWNIYNGGDDFSVGYRWGYDSTEEIKTETQDGAVAKFSWNGMTQEWAYVSAMIKGSDTTPIMTSGFKRIVFTVVGTAGQSALFKFQLKDNSKNKELSVNLTGEEQTIEVDITGVLSAAQVDEYLACIFPAPGAKGTDPVGEIVLKSCKLDKTAVYVEPVLNKADLAQLYFDTPDGIDNCFTLTNDKHVSTINVNKTATGWETIRYKVGKVQDWFNLAEYTRVYAKITSNKATHVLLKMYDTKEQWVELEAGVAQEVSFSIDAAIVDESKVTCIFISTNEGDALQCTVTVEDFKLYKASALNIGASNEASVPMINAGGNYSATPVEGGFKVSYTKEAAGWDSIENLVSANFNFVNAIRGTVVADVDTHVLFKPCDLGANEKMFELKAGIPQSFDFKFNTNNEWTPKFLIFICTNEGDALTGNVTITGLTFYAYGNGASNLENKGDYGTVYIDNYFRADECYNLSRSEHTVTVNYEKSASGWESMAAHITMGDTWYNPADYRRVSATISANVNVKVLLKAYDKNTGEHWVNVEANKTTYVNFVLDEGVAEGGKDFIVFICAGDDAGALNGTVTIKDLKVARLGTNDETAEGVYVNSLAPKAGYTVTPTTDAKGMTVAYEKEATGWDACEFFLSAAHPESYNHISAKVTASENTHILFKAFDNGANERYFELVAGVETTVEIDVTPAAGQWACKQIIFFATNEGDALSATVTFSSFLYCVK